MAFAAALNKHKKVVWYGGVREVEAPILGLKENINCYTGHKNKEERRRNRAKNDHLVCHIKGGNATAQRKWGEAHVVEDRRNKAKNGKSILLGTNLFRF